jgi:hypothetical protein
MMGARIGMSFLWAVGCYLAAAAAGYFLILTMSSNTHDRQMEAGMTAAFFIGPIAAIIGFIVNFVRLRP